MYSNELGRLPVYEQFKFYDSAPCMPVQSSDDVVNLIPGPMGTPSDMQCTYAPDPSFEGQVMENPVVVNRAGNDQIAVTSANFAAFSSGSAFDFDGLSHYDPRLTMDNTTMAVWSAAPTNLEYVFLPLFVSLLMLHVSSRQNGRLEFLYL